MSAQQVYFPQLQTKASETQFNSSGYQLRYVNLDVASVLEGPS
jgi:hypothetical protein